MKNVDLNFVCRVLSIFDGFNGLSNDDVWWRTDDEYAPITLFINCNDVFLWGCSDCEEVTPDNIAILEQCVKDVELITERRRHAEVLFCCRVRNMRPQGAYYEERYCPKELWSLFDAAGPERETGVGNPKPRPAAA